MYSLLFIGVVSFLLALLLTPAVRHVSRRWGVLDHPDRMRKTHQLAVPRVGGIGIALAYTASFAILLIAPLRGGNLLLQSLRAIWGLIPAGIVIFSTGLLDDLFGLKPPEKLIGQFAAAVLAFFGGLHVDAFGGFHLNPWVSLPVTIVWLLACTNSFNLIDGVDGLAAGVGLFATCTMLIAAFVQHNVPLALATVPLAGALLGFLRYNFNPATIFLGDSGSLLLGFLLGCYGVLWSEKSATILGMTAPMMALSIPLLDTVLAIGRRFLRQQPIFTADRGHIHHRLLDRGFTPRKVVLVLYACCAIGAVCSLATAKGNSSWPVIVIFCAVTWIGIEHLGYVEFGMFGRMFMEGAFRRLLNSHIALHAFEQQLAAAPTPDECWNVIQSTATEFGFHHMEMRLAGRTFHHRNGFSPDRAWNIRIPLSPSDYIQLTREFESSTQAGTIAPFADVLRRALVAKLPTFDAVEHRSVLHLAAHGD